jgi:hypothetical protein
MDDADTGATEAGAGCGPAGDDTVGGLDVKGRGRFGAGQWSKMRVRPPAA